MDKRDYRLGLARDHAKTRGVSNAAFANTMYLRRIGRYLTLAVCVLALVLALVAHQVLVLSGVL